MPEKPQSKARASSDSGDLLDPSASPLSASAGIDLTAGMSALSSMIRDLEGQLDRMIDLNSALQEQLESERANRVATERQLEAAREQLGLREQDAATRENLASELSQLSHERTRIVERLRTLEAELEAQKGEGQARESLIRQLRAARADVLDEITSVESQFEHAMQMLAQMRSRVTVLQEERDAMGGRMRLTETKLLDLQHEREFLVREVDQSRAALDEIRRSLVEACVVSADGRARGA